ncbi:MAG: hypothetical protein K0S65_5786 [Labilithrix sp.]|nr:hypothetical protein [Labilithrix sp.]
MKWALHQKMSDEATREIAGLVGAVLFGTASLMELVRMAMLKIPWPGFTSRIDWVIGAAAVVLWVGSAYVLARRSHKHRIVPILGAFALLAYGVLGTVARSRFGIVYIVFAMMMPVIERIAFRGKLPIGQRIEEPIRPPSGREIL